MYLPQSEMVPELSLPASGEPYIFFEEEIMDFQSFPLELLYFI